jgi:sulfite reductase alpha subunit-like flavoprotein
LSRVNVGETVVIWIESGAISTANISASQPLLLVGPGTGVAPLRSLVYERILQSLNSASTLQAQLTAGRSRADVLAFGCRRWDADFLYGHDWHGLTQFVTGVYAQQGQQLTSQVLTEQVGAFTGSYSKNFESGSASSSSSASMEVESLTSAEAYSAPNMTTWQNKTELLHVLVAFSQDQDRKYYVTDALKEPANRERVWEIVNSRDGVVFICGSAKNMPKDVRAAIKVILVDKLTSVSSDANVLSVEDAGAQADRILQTMEREKRYIVEAWC